MVEAKGFEIEPSQGLRREKLQEQSLGVGQGDKGKPRARNPRERERDRSKNSRSTNTFDIPKRRCVGSMLDGSQQRPILKKFFKKWKLLWRVTSESLIVCTQMFRTGHVLRRLAYHSSLLQAQNLRTPYMNAWSTLFVFDYIHCTQRQKISGTEVVS